MQEVVLRFFCHQFVQVLLQAGLVTAAKPRAQIISDTSEEAQVHFTLRSDSQPIATLAEIFAVRCDKAYAAGKIAVAVFPCRTGMCRTGYQLPAFCLQACFYGSGRKCCLPKKAVLSRVCISSIKRRVTGRWRTKSSASAKVRDI